MTFIGSKIVQKKIADFEHPTRRGTYRVRCEMHCVMREMRSVLKGHVYMKPTASCGAAQLWV